MLKTFFRDVTTQSNTAWKRQRERDRWAKHVVRSGTVTVQHETWSPFLKYIGTRLATLVLKGLVCTVCTLIDIIYYFIYSCRSPSISLSPPHFVLSLLGVVYLFQGISTCVRMRFHVLICPTPLSSVFSACRQTMWGLQVPDLTTCLHALMPTVCHLILSACFFSALGFVT